MPKYFPKQGDIIMIDAEPHTGHEYGGHNANKGNIRRPMIVLSKSSYNANTGMVMGMLLTSAQRKFAPQMYKPFADAESGVHGHIVLWQVPNFDHIARHAKTVGHVDEGTLQELIQIAVDILQ